MFLAIIAVDSNMECREIVLSRLPGNIHEISELFDTELDSN